MSHSFRPEPRDSVRRPRRQVRIEPVQALEDRRLLTPIVTTNSLTATFVPAAAPTNTDLGTVTVTQTPLATSAAPLTSVSELTSANSFGGDIVRIKAGPGGVFGSGVYAISRGAGDNADATFRNPDISAPINKPGVIYRVDPATGQTSVFFDLNTVQSQLTTGGDASNGATPGSGLLNYYDIAFDPEGVFDGKPSMFVSSLSTTNASNNVIYRIAPDGTFMGLYIQFTTDANENNFVRQPTAIYIPPVEQQNFLKGLFVGQGTGVSADERHRGGGIPGPLLQCQRVCTGLVADGRYPAHRRDDDPVHLRAASRIHLGQQLVHVARSTRRSPTSARRAPAASRRRRD